MYRLGAYLAMLLVAAAWSSQSVLAAGADRQAGAALARLHCSRCHVIPDYNTMGIGSTPSFKAMVQSPAADWREKFEAFFTLPPHGNFVRIREYRQIRQTPSTIAPIVIGLDDLDHIMAYVDELAGRMRQK